MTLRLLASLLCTSTLMACDNTVDNTNTVTLSSGLEITLQKEQCNSTEKQKPTLIQRPAHYQLKLANFFSCDSRQEVYLTPEIDHKNSFVFFDKGENGKCECMKTFEINIANKLLSKGDTMYVVYNNEVIDHLTVP